jgi:hypothetical protein
MVWGSRDPPCDMWVSRPIARSPLGPAVGLLMKQIHIEVTTRPNRDTIVQLFFLHYYTITKRDRERNSIYKKLSFYFNEFIVMTLQQWN